jgi:hypothetical protein
MSRYAPAPTTKPGMAEAMCRARALATAHPGRAAVQTALFGEVRWRIEGEVEEVTWTRDILPPRASVDLSLIDCTLSGMRLRRVATWTEDMTMRVRAVRAGDDDEPMEAA